MVFPVRSAIEATIRLVKNASKATTVKTETGQVKRQGYAWTVFFLLKLNCLHGFNLRRCNCKQNPLQGDPWSFMRFNSS